jgi:uncharacterized protein YbjQ (UPF0145 family)
MSIFNHNDSHTSSGPLQANGLAGMPLICTSLSGNEIYCVALAGYNPGNMLMGNSVFALGAIGGMVSNVHATFGGEVPQFTSMISEGRRLALERFEHELEQSGAAGATGLSSEVVFHPGNIEFLSIGSSLYRRDGATQSGVMTSAADGQELFCQMDAGFQPIRLAFGNAAYALGLGRNLLGSLRQMGHGEISEYSDMFTNTRNLSLKRIVADATHYNANAVVGIRTTIVPIGVKGVQEMMMIGTASYHASLASLAPQVGGVITSDLTAQEMWNVMKLGYAPTQLVLGTSVYSLGVIGGIRAALRGIARGEVSALTELVYGAREQSLKKVQSQAQSVGADMVMGIKTYIYQLGNNLIEFLAVGTAVKRMSGLTPRSEQLPPQAIISDKDTFIDTTMSHLGADVSHEDGGVAKETNPSQPAGT